MPIQLKLVAMLAALQPARPDPFATLNDEQRAGGRARRGPATAGRRRCW